MTRRTVIFDFGAVLFQWQPDQLLMQTLPAHARDVAQARALAARIFQSFTPDSDWARFDLGLLDEPALAQRIAGRTGLSTTDVMRLIEAVPEHLQAQPETVALFHALKAAGHRLVYLSNMPRPYADHLERSHAFIAGFDDGVFSARVGLMKPWPAIYELASLRFGLEGQRDRALFIDDHAGNVEAGLRHGWQALRFESAAQVRTALQQQGWL